MADTGQPPDPALLAQIHTETAQAQATAAARDPEDPGTGAINARTYQAKQHATQATTAAAVGQGYQFTPEAIDVQLRHCQDQIMELQDDLETARAGKAAVHPPAPDAASVAQADAIRNMFESAINAINADIAYLTDWQNKLATAKQNYLDTEHLTEDQWKRLTLGLKP